MGGASRGSLLLCRIQLRRFPFCRIPLGRFPLRRIPLCRISWWVVPPDCSASRLWQFYFAHTYNCYHQLLSWWRMSWWLIKTWMHHQGNSITAMMTQLLARRIEDREVLSSNPTQDKRMYNSHISRWINWGVKMVTDDASLRPEFWVSTGRRSIRNPQKPHFACILRHNIITSPLKLGTRRAPQWSIVCHQLKAFWWTLIIRTYGSMYHYYSGS